VLGITEGILLSRAGFAVLQKDRQDANPMLCEEFLFPSPKNGYQLHDVR